MSDRLVPALCASLFCVGIWSAMAGLAAFLGHRRMISSERDLGAPAVPRDEWAYVWYAGASVVWLSALVLAIVGLTQKKWARAGRNCLVLFLAHMTLATLAAAGSVLSDAASGTRGSPLPLVLMACSMAAFGVCSASAFGWRFAGARTARIEQEPGTGASPPGIERWAIYVLSALMWPVGFGAAFVYGKPENVRVGATALRISLAQLVVITLATCTAIAAFVATNV